MKEDHKRIWLEPSPGADEEYGRQWMHHNVWGDEATEYVRVDLAQAALEDAQNDALAAEAELRIVRNQFYALHQRYREKEVGNANS